MQLTIKSLAFGSVAAVIGLSVLSYAFTSDIAHAALPAANVADGGDADAAQIARGAYLARAGDCIACHSVPGKAQFIGGLPIKSNLGTIYSTNITPDPEHGIGRYTEQQFGDAVRKGVRADGTHLYPAMPYPDFAKITDADVHSLYVYFMKGVPADPTPSPTTALSFPFNQRWGMALWNWAFARSTPFQPNASHSAEINRGAYLVQGLGHCSSCHTARGIAMQERALDDSSDQFLGGAKLGDWTAPSLRGMPGWTVADISEYLGSGRNHFAAVGGEMKTVVADSMSYMNDADLTAIALYLKSLPGRADASAQGAAAPTTASNATVTKLSSAQNLTLGERLYVDNCAACHFVTGHGAPRVFPRLDGAAIVNAADPGGFLHVILEGASTPSTAAAPSILPMPGFAKRLNDDDVAALATFVRSGWSNHAGAVSASDVAKIRANIVPTTASR